MSKNFRFILHTLCHIIYIIKLFLIKSYAFIKVINYLFLLILEELLDRNIACSHLRAWQLFIESIRSQNEKCKFIAWPCPQGGLSYTKGICFPMESSDWNQEMGYAANRGPLGTYYLSTRAETPFCGNKIYR